MDKAVARDAKGLLGERFGIVLKDLGTGYLGFYPMAQRDTAHTERAVVGFFGYVKPGLISTHGASEFRSASTNLFMPHCTSTPGRHETTGVAERVVQLLPVATRPLLAHPGLEHMCWPFVGRMAALGLNAAECVE